MKGRLTCPAGDPVVGHDVSVGAVAGEETGLGAQGVRNLAARLAVVDGARLAHGCQNILDGEQAGLEKSRFFSKKKNFRQGFSASS